MVWKSLESIVRIPALPLQRGWDGHAQHTLLAFGYPSPVSADGSGSSTAMQCSEDTEQLRLGELVFPSLTWPCRKFLMRWQ